MLLPVRDNIVVKPVKKEMDIITPKHLEENTNLAEVVAVGAGVKTIKPKQNIYFRKYEATKIDEFFVIKEEDVLCILK